MLSTNVLAEDLNLVKEPRKITVSNKRFDNSFEIHLREAGDKNPIILYVTPGVTKIKEVKRALLKIKKQKKRLKMFKRGSELNNKDIINIDDENTYTFVFWKEPRQKSAHKKRTTISKKPFENSFPIGLKEIGARNTSFFHITPGVTTVKELKLVLLKLNPEKEKVNLVKYGQVLNESTIIEADGDQLYANIVWLK